MKLILLVFYVSVARADTPSTLAQSMTSQQLISVGREAFLNRCSGCHGESAEGNGPAATMLDPKPRNLVAGSFKLRSTPAGVLPSVGDLLRTLNQGIPGTSMPPFREVSEPEKLALVAYVRSLRPEFREGRDEQQSIALPPPPKEIFGTKAGLLTGAARGRKLYETNCMTCHGTKGLGDGPSHEGMTDSDDRPIKPANLTSRVFKSGPTAGDAFKAISTGLLGAPMPSYEAQLSEAQRWDLVAYVFYLRGKAAGTYSEKDELK